MLMRMRIITLGCLLLAVTMMMAQGIKWHQYWIDSDYSGQKTVTSSNTTFTLTVSIADLTPGIHFLNYRALNTDDEWGTLSRTLFYIPAADPVTATIKSCEYWIDEDYANRKNGSNTTTITATIDVSKLSSGIHFFNYRAVNNFGETGTLSRTLFYIPERVSGDAQIAEYEYWIDNNIANKVTGKDAKDVYTLTKDVSTLADGDHTFTFRAKNTDGVWGTLYTETFTIDRGIAATLLDFADAKTEAVCVANWDTDGDGYLSKTEAAAVTSIGDVFKGNDEITSFGELQHFTGLTSLDADAFRSCTKLESIVLPEGLQTIGNNAFTNCPSLKTLHIPASLATISEESVFHYCLSLTGFTVDEANTSFCAEDGILYNKDKTELVCCPASKTGSLSLPSTLKTIRPSGFAMCTKLTTLNLPASLTKISDAAFVGCSGLLFIDFAADSQLSEIGIGSINGCSSLIAFRSGNNHNAKLGQNYEIFGGVLYDVKSGSRKLVSYPNMHGSIFTIPEGVTDIMDYAFLMTDINEVTLPASLKGLHEYAFTSCEKLTKVTSLAWQPCDATNVFTGSTANTVLYVRKGTKSAYVKAKGWDGFKEIVEFISYDVNEDGKIDNNDLQAIVDYIMGKASEDFIWQKADINGDSKVDAADVVKVVSIIKKNMPKEIDPEAEEPQPNFDEGEEDLL